MILTRISPTTLIIFTIIGLVFIFSKCMNGSSINSNDARGAEYAGSKSCNTCHTKISSSYSHTSHFRTSWPVRKFPENWITKKRFFFNDSVAIALEKTDSGFFQTEYLHNQAEMSRPFQMGIGSGDEAVSFAYWQNKKLYQLPLSYFETIQGWANSPGFPSSEPYFNRPILIRCFECHGSFARDDAGQNEGLGAIPNIDSASIIYGIDCERCHGPAANHVNFHTSNPAEKTAKYIVSWKSLSRQQKLDACAVCHSGNDVALQYATFGFQPGDTFSKYKFPFSNSSVESDVHGKQMQLLAESQCFLVSKTLECGSCHKPHEEVPRNAVGMSASCKNCHGNPHKVGTIADSVPSSLQNNCIDCHMPFLPSKKINIQGETGQEAQAYLLRTHKIAIYPENSKVPGRRSFSVGDKSQKSKAAGSFSP